MVDEKLMEELERIKDMNESNIPSSNVMEVKDGPKRAVNPDGTFTEIPTELPVQHAEILTEDTPVSNLGGGLFGNSFTHSYDANNVYNNTKTFKVSSAPRVSVKEYDINVRFPTYEPINGKYDEDELIEEIRNHIRKTYSQHYVNKKGEQTVDSAKADGDLMPWARTNVKKYISRYGKKEGYNRADLLKAVHNLIFMLHSDNEMREEQKANTDNEL